MKVLIVDDSELLRERLKKTLSKNDDLLIAEAKNCEEAYKYLDEFYFEAVILDISLPDDSGIIILQKLKKTNLNTVVIMLTNYATAQFRNICSEYGADYFLDKTKDINEVNILIEKMNYAN